MTNSKADEALGEAERLWMAGEAQRARESFRRARMLYHQDQDAGGQATALTGLGDLEARLGHLDAAREAFTEARVLLAPGGDQRR